MEAAVTFKGHTPADLLGLTPLAVPKALHCPKIAPTAGSHLFKHTSRGSFTSKRNRMFSRCAESSLRLRTAVSRGPYKPQHPLG